MQTSFCVGVVIVLTLAFALLQGGQLIEEEGHA